MLSMPIMPSSRPEARHQQRPDQRGRRHVGEEDQAEHEQSGVFRRPEPERDGRERRRDQGQHHHAECAADPGADRRDAERRAGAAFLRHGVAVDAGHHRRGFARNAHQDRGGRAAILRAVIDAGEHDDGLRGVEAEGHRQQDGNAGQRPDARQHADQRADQAAEKRVPQVGRRKGDGKAVCQAEEGGFHGDPRIRAARPGAASSARRRTAHK